MSQIRMRPANRSDLPCLTEIYNHYVIHTPVTFDVEPFTVERRVAWFEQFANAGWYRLLVAEDSGTIVRYTSTSPFRPKSAYETTVETSVYCRPETLGQRIGSQLYAVLFETIAGEDIHRIVAGYTLPNPASAALHERFGSGRWVYFARTAASSGATGTFAGWKDR